MPKQLSRGNNSWILAPCWPGWRAIPVNRTATPSSGSELPGGQTTFLASLASGATSSSAATTRVLHEKNDHERDFKQLRSPNRCDCRIGALTRAPRRARTWIGSTTSGISWVPRSR